jgi:sulfate adenylyltransferase subunit 2
MSQVASIIEQVLDGCSAYQAWDTDKLAAALADRGGAVSKRTFERQIVASKWFPPALIDSQIVDECGRKSVRPVLEWAMTEAARRRGRILFLQLHMAPNGRWYLHANDRRDERFWVLLERNDRANVERGVAALQVYIGKEIAIFPHGPLVGLLRNFENPERIWFCPQVYRSVLDEDGLKSQRKLAHLPISPHLRRLEAESIFIMREAIAEAQNPVMLYSIGKDSGVMLHLARKAFYPSPPPFPLLHVDTRWKFHDMYLFREFMARDSGMELIVHINPDAIARNINPFDHGSALHTDITKTEGLKQALDHYQFDLIFGGARRDEEKSRAKERVFSFRTATHRWDPKNQRPELWRLYNTKKNPGESIRVFPLSNWTELDIWQYIYQENIPVVPLYFAKPRPVIIRPDMTMMVDDERCRLLPGEDIQVRKVRFRTLGCYPLTGAVESEAETVEDILLEVINARQSERQGRKIDSDSAGSMEKKKQEGYF